MAVQNHGSLIHIDPCGSSHSPDLCSNMLHITWQYRIMDHWSTLIRVDPLTHLTFALTCCTSHGSTESWITDSHWSVWIICEDQLDSELVLVLGWHGGRGRLRPGAVGRSQYPQVTGGGEYITWSIQQAQNVSSSQVQNNRRKPVLDGTWNAERLAV